MHIHPSSPNSASPQSEESAAIKIQAGFRGYRVRKQLYHHHHHQTPRRCSTNGYHRSGNSYRRRQQRQLQMERQGGGSSEGAFSVSAQLRDERSSSSSEGSSMEDRCATKIQASVRGFLVRKKQKIATDAATKIQAGFRGFKARKELKQK